MSLVKGHIMDQVEATQAQQNFLHSFTHSETLYSLQELLTYVKPDVKLQDGSGYTHKWLS